MNAELKTERLTIVPVAMEHLDDIAEYACDLENAPYMIYLPYPSKEAYEKYLRESIERWNSDDPDIYEFAVKLDSKVIGGISIYMSPERDFGELGWIINKRYWRNGYAYEAASAVMKFARDELGLHTLTAECDDRNFASYSLMEKLGFTMETRDSFRHYERTGETARERKYIINI